MRWFDRVALYGIFSFVLLFVVGVVYFISGNFDESEVFRESATVEVIREKGRTVSFEDIPQSGLRTPGFPNAVYRRAYVGKLVEEIEGVHSEEVDGYPNH
ncbi:MAG: hypothetical protein JJU00_16700 [Opitutales bacterium]|nr:hypothetical protein [Opitutales bacterium]